MGCGASNAGAGSYLFNSAIACVPVQSVARAACLTDLRPPHPHNGAMNIFEALRISHVTQRTLADHLIQTQGDSPERASIFTELKRELAAHASAEERFFYQ